MQLLSPFRASTVSSFVRFLSSVHLNQLPKTLELLGQKYIVDKAYNLNPKVLSCIGKNLHLKEQHPLWLLKRNIENFFVRRYLSPCNNTPIFSFVDNLSPVVTIDQNFDSLLIPQSHPSRRPEDTYYVNQHHVLRSHTSAHQVELIKSGIDAFLCFGDTYRRDAVDRTHYPVFHQMEGVRLFSPGALADLSSKGKADPSMFVVKNHGPKEPNHQELHSVAAAQVLEKNLKGCLEDLCKHIFGPGIQFRWVEEYFPFTHPSWELEIFWQGYWLEVLGCGIVQQQILKNSGAGDYLGWAFGMGLERLAMALYEIPDIRIFWSEDERFLNQFAKAKPETRLTYQPVSTQPPVYNDMSFWLPKKFAPTDFFDLVRHVAGDIVESVVLRDEFKKNEKTSHCYRFTYRSPTQALTQDEVTKIHEDIRKAATNQLGVQLRV